MSATHPHHLQLHLPPVRWPAIPRERRPRVSRELLGGLALFSVYLLVDALNGSSRTAAARSHGERVIRLEQWLQLDVEGRLNSWLAGRPGLMTVANYEYATTYIVSAALLLVITYVWTPALYRQARNSFVVLNLLAFACFAFFPLMPPRMMPGYVDTVSSGGTVGSWGSPLVASANQLAAMPSLHMAWALWVSVMLARMSHRRWLQVASAIHVAVTLYVVLATANHFVVDALGAAVVVLAAVAVTEWWQRRHPGTALPTADAFFLDVETPGHAQNVGGLVLMGAPLPSYARVQDTIGAQLDELPHFTEQLAAPGVSRWVPAGPIDWSHHLVEVALPPGSDLADLDVLVGELTAQELPRDRPLWRAWVIRGVGGQAAFCIVMHHCMADGIGAVAKLLNLLEPPYELPIPAREGPSAMRRSAGVIQGLAQLATDGKPATVLPTGGPRRGFATFEVPLETVRDAARAHRMRVTELLLAATGSALAAVDPALAQRCGEQLRVSVPVMLRAPGAGADDGGNLTGAVLLDVPARNASPADLRDEVCRRGGALRTPTRALASRWVMATALRAAPPAGRRWFARTVYGPKYFQAIVSNMPGPDQRFTLAGGAVDRVHPILPPAPGIPLTIGALSWNGMLGITVVTDAGLLDARAYAEALDAHLLASDRRVGTEIPEFPDHPESDRIAR
ncbi:MAG TPA: phosphatase PAP2 family protein [Flexivirga sp.]|uniref:bifunctional phosphatase PAP2/O-acyltransferase family protein n=1 Tax=Flexivirga sp. TaxID=1962927 RepID=UPI002BD2CE84|nr:phosphatase PAP2 family protein [Flexivirga sp.]HWC22704.1 phosphatase PAP2 family protein [Flexivirga sp.]